MLVKLDNFPYSQVGVKVLKTYFKPPPILHSLRQAARPFPIFQASVFRLLFLAEQYFRLFYIDGLSVIPPSETQIPQT